MLFASPRWNSIRMLKRQFKFVKKSKPKSSAFFISTCCKTPSAHSKTNSLSSNSCSFWKNCTVSKVLLQMGRKITKAQSLKQKSRTKGMQLYSEDKHGIKRQTKSRAIEIHSLHAEANMALKWVQT